MLARRWNRSGSDMTLYLVNGSTDAQVSPLDRGLAYGDGLFETLRVHRGRIIFLEAHLARMQAGCTRLNLQFNTEAFRPDLQQLLSREQPSDGVLKLVVTRGVGGRGYRPTAETSPVRIASLHALPPESASPGNAFVCRQRLSLQPALSGIKHLNRLEQVIASMEWPDETFVEGLMLDYNGLPIEGTRSNLFVVHKGTILTPDLPACGIAGILRQYLIEKLQPEVFVEAFDLHTLLDADELFFCNSVLGIIPIAAVHTESTIVSFRETAVTELAKQIFRTALQTC